MKKQSEYQRQYGHYAKQLMGPLAMEALTVLAQLNDGRIEKNKKQK